MNPGDILKLVGGIVIFTSATLSWYRAMNDENMDKSDMFLGGYLIEYPFYTISLIIGIVIYLLGKAL